MCKVRLSSQHSSKESQVTSGSYPWASGGHPERSYLVMREVINARYRLYLGLACLLGPGEVTVCLSVCCRTSKPLRQFDCRFVRLALHVACADGEPAKGMARLSLEWRDREGATQSTVFLQLVLDRYCTRVFTVGVYEYCIREYHPCMV